MRGGGDGGKSFNDMAEGICDGWLGDLDSGLGLAEGVCIYKEEGDEEMGDVKTVW